MENNNSKNVIEFIASYWNEPLDNISNETRIEDDLGITGDDAIEFMEEFQNEFNVDLNTFEFDKHFGPEASFDPRLILILALIGLIFGFLHWKIATILVVVFIVTFSIYRQKTKKNRVNPNTLRVKHLVNAASEKKWNFKYINTKA